MTIHRGTCVATALLLSGCSTIFGTDFDARPRAEASGGEGRGGDEDVEAESDATEPTESGGAPGDDARGGRSDPEVAPTSPSDEGGGASTPPAPTPALPQCPFTRVGAGATPGAANTTTNGGRLTLSQSGAASGVLVATPAPPGLDVRVKLLHFAASGGALASLVVHCVGVASAYGISLRHEPATSTTPAAFRVTGGSFASPVGSATAPVPATMRARAVNGEVHFSFTGSNGTTMRYDLTNCVPEVVGLELGTANGTAHAVFDDFIVAGHCESTFAQPVTY